MSWCLQERVWVAVFWKDLSDGVGPSLSAYVDAHELLRFDCYEGGPGHYHVFQNDRQAWRGRIEVLEGTIDEQIESTLRALSRSLSDAIQRHDDRKVREIVLDQSAVEAALPVLRARLRDYGDFAIRRRSRPAVPASPLAQSRTGLRRRNSSSAGG